MRFKKGDWIINKNLSIIYWLAEDVDFGDSREVVSKAYKMLLSEKKRPNKKRSKVLKDAWVIAENEPILLGRKSGWHLANKRIIDMCKNKNREN